MASQYYDMNCSQWFKDTNLKANHNSLARLLRLL